MKELRRRHTLNEPLYAAIDQLRLYEAKLLPFSELKSVDPERLRLYYNRTGHNTIRAHKVVDGIVVVRVE